MIEDKGLTDNHSFGNNRPRGALKTRLLRRERFRYNPAAIRGFTESASV
jgi:hypothetical protein